MSDESATVNETCTCGSTFQYTGPFPLKNAHSWRKNHHHEPPLNEATGEPRARTIALTGTHLETGYVDLGFTTGAEK